MNIHRIQDLSNAEVIDILTKGLSTIEKDNIKANYSPDHKDDAANLFFILEHGRFSNGAYYIAEEDGEFICSSGWNAYSDTIALAMVRSFVAKRYRNSYIMSSTVLPSILEDVKGFERVWITMNDYNKPIYDWFVAASEGRPRKGWPTIYESFKPIGKRIVNYTNQWTVEQLKSSQLS